MKNIAKKADKTPGDNGRFFADECNSIVKELKQTVKLTGQNFSDSDNNQVVKAINRLGKGFYYKDYSESNNIYSLRRDTIDESIDQNPIDGEALFFRPHATNTQAATVEISGTAPLSIVRKDNTPLLGGEIIANQLYILIYNAEIQSYNYIEITFKEGEAYTKSEIKALVVFKSGLRGVYEGNNAMAMIDRTQSFGIKSVTLDFVSKKPANVHEFYNWQSLALRVYKFELSLSPIDATNSNINFNSNGDNVLYEWKSFKTVLENTGRDHPYSKRVVHYLTHMAKSAGLLSVLDASGEPAIENAKEWFIDLQNKYPDWDNPFDYGQSSGTGDNHLDGQFHGGGLEWKGSNYIRIPNDV